VVRSCVCEEQRGRIDCRASVHYTMGEPDAKPRPKSKGLAQRDPLAGLGSYQAVMEFEWAALRIGDRLGRRCALIGVIPRDRASSAAGASEVQAFIYSSQAGDLINIRRGTWIRAERHASKERKNNTSCRSLTHPTTAEMTPATNRIIRGSEPRYWEDVTPGDELQEDRARTVAHQRSRDWHIAGNAVDTAGGFRISTKYEKRRRAFYAQQLNVPDRCSGCIGRRMGERTRRADQLTTRRDARDLLSTPSYHWMATTDGSGR